MKEVIIIKNRIKCLKCGDIIESNSVHHFVTCSCGACSVDGGHEYLRRCGNPGDWQELNITATKENVDKYIDKFCNKCGSQRCEGVLSEWFDGCEHKGEFETIQQKEGSK